MRPKEAGPEGEDTGHRGKRKTAFSDNPPKVPTAFSMTFNSYQAPQDATQAPSHLLTYPPTHSLSLPTLSDQSPLCHPQAEPQSHHSLPFSPVKTLLSQDPGLPSFPSPLPGPRWPILLSSSPYPPISLSQAMLLPPRIPELTAEPRVPPCGALNPPVT